MTGTIDVLKAIAEGKGPSKWIVSLGYAGWGEGQLDEEMTRHGWFAADGTSEILFDTPADERWEAAFRGEGVDPRLLSTHTGAAWSLAPPLIDRKMSFVAAVRAAPSHDRNQIAVCRKH